LVFFVIFFCIEIRSHSGLLNVASCFIIIGVELYGVSMSPSALVVQVDDLSAATGREQVVGKGKPVDW